MLVTRKSIMTGDTHSIDLPVTQEQLDQYETGYFLIQDVFPQLDAAQREFIKTGVTEEEWDEGLGEESEVSG